MNPLPNPIPEIYVLRHPQCELGEFLARRIHGWLRQGNGLGPQVFYRSLAAPEATAGGLPPPLPGESRGAPPTSSAPRVSNLQIVLPLIDEHMIADAAWRHWLTELTSPQAASQPREFMPVALDSTAYNAPERLREKNFLRPAGLPLPPSAKAAPIADAAAEQVLRASTLRALAPKSTLAISPETPEIRTAKELAARSLLKQLTEAMCTLMLGKATPPAAAAPANPAAPSPRDGPAPKVRIFLSHAKVDGTVPTRRIRDYIYSQTQLAAFYDENDIPFGSASGACWRQTSGPTRPPR